MVGCASYAQDIPDLDQLCQSTRLSNLLAKDLDARRKANKPKKGQGQNQSGKQGQGNQGNKGRGSGGGSGKKKK